MDPNNRTNRHNRKKTDGLDEKTQTNDQKKTIGREQPIRSRESIQQIYGFVREQRNNERHRNILSVKTGTPPVKQKARFLPLHLQENVGREFEKLIKSGHLAKIHDVNEDCFVSPVVTTLKSDKPVKIALGSRKLNDSCI